MSSKKGILLILLSALMFGSYGVWSKLIGTDHGVFYPGWTRSLLIAVILFPILFKLRQIVRIKKQDWGWMAVFLISTSLTQAPLLYAFNHMDIGAATLLFFVSMLLTMYVVGFVFFGEHMTAVKIISFVIACGGLVVTFSFSIQAFVFLAAIMAILNGIASGSEISFSKKLTGSYPTLYISWLSWIFIALTNAAISLFLGETQFMPELSIFWAYQIFYGIASVVGFWAVMQGFKYVEASIGGLLGLLEIVFSLLLGLLIFSQALGNKVLLGAVLILIAAALPHVVELLHKRKDIIS